jgi:threonine/homoserine/homoserine lactone efflux protein
MNLLLFLLRVVGISLSGVMAPGPVTATTISMGARSRYAGALIAIGHGVVEFPLMVLIVLGAGRILKLPVAQIIIGLAGGAFLLMMAVGMLRSLRSAGQQETKVAKSAPLLAGIVLSAGNPYFLFWWATVGLALATMATGIGIWAFVLFAVVHWLCDFVWLTILSWASFKGTGLFGPWGQRIVLLVCAVALIFFGLFFIYNAVEVLRNLQRSS